MCEGGAERGDSVGLWDWALRGTWGDARDQGPSMGPPNSKLIKVK